MKSVSSYTQTPNTRHKGLQDVAVEFSGNWGVGLRTPVYSERSSEPPTLQTLNKEKNDGKRDFDRTEDTGECGGVSEWLLA